MRRISIVKAALRLLILDGIHKNLGNDIANGLDLRYEKVFWTEIGDFFAGAISGPKIKEATGKVKSSNIWH